MLQRRSFVAALTIMLVGLFLVMTAQAVNLTTAENPPAYDLTLIFTTMAALSLAVLTLTSFVKRVFNTNDTITIIWSAVAALALSTVGFLVKAGIFIAVEWWYIFIYGIAAMLIANGLSTWEVIKTILEFFKLKVPAK